MSLYTNLRRKGISTSRVLIVILSFVFLYLLFSPTDKPSSDFNDYHNDDLDVPDELYRPKLRPRIHNAGGNDLEQIANLEDQEIDDERPDDIMRQDAPPDQAPARGPDPGSHSDSDSADGALEPVHVVFAFGRDYIVPAFVAVNSSLTNARNRERLVIHLLVEAEIVNRVEMAFAQAFGTVADVSVSSGRQEQVDSKDEPKDVEDPLDEWDDGENVDNGGFGQDNIAEADADVPVDVGNHGNDDPRLRQRMEPRNIRPVIEVVAFDVSSVPPRKVWQGPQNLLNPLNYARFQLPQIFPTLRKVLYIDPDVVVQGDLGAMWDRFLVTDQYVVAAATSPGEKYSKFILDYNIAKVDKNTDYFNAGVMVINLRLWKERNKDREILKWLNLNRKSPVYKYGSQPPLMLTFYKDYENMPMSWNFRHLGHKQTLKDSDIRRSHIIHYNGPRKPWRGNGIDQYRKYWTRYYHPSKETHDLLVWGFEELQDSFLTSSHISCNTRPACIQEATRMGVQSSYVHFDAWPNKPKYLPALMDFFGSMWGFKQAKFLLNNEYRWRFLWIRKQSDLQQRLKATGFNFKKVDGTSQIVNYIPGIYEESYHKDQLCRNSQRFVAKHGKEVAGSGFLSCYILPEQHALLLEASRLQPEKVWIGKMIAESSGKGIELYAGMNQLPAPTQLEKRVVQEYVEDPFLVNVLQGKRKTDLRIYAVITSFDPVRIYLHTAGQVKVAQSVYSNNFTNHFAHISNAVGSAEDPYDLKNKTLRVERQIDEFKWRLTLDDLRGLVGTELYRDAWQKVEDLIVRTVMSFGDKMGCKSTKYPYPCGAAYQLLGVDIVFDADMVPHLMEVNNDPGWNPYYEKRKYTVATKGGNANGAKCLFPFVYQGTKHLECIPKSKTDPTLWCYTDEYESWGECDQTSENAHNKDSLQQVFNAVYGDLVFLTGVIPYDPEFELVVIERYETLCAAALMPAACRIEQVKNKVVVMANEMQARGDFRMVFPQSDWKENYGTYLQADSSDPDSVGHTSDNDLLAIHIFSNFFSYDFQDAALYRK